MDSVILDNIAFRADVPQLLKMVHLEDDDGDDATAARTLAAEAEVIARPKALYKIAYVDEKGDEHVTIDGIRLSSRVLRVNLDTAQRVFAYVATAGMELERWADSKEDILERFWAEAIFLMALRSASTHLSDHVQERYRPGMLARMNPGSLEDWPLRQQQPLFSLLGDVQGSIGVQLTDSYLMVPRKSVSGIMYPTEETFESCQLCGREACPNRRAPYDPGLFERKYSPAAT